MCFDNQLDNKGFTYRALNSTSDDEQEPEEESGPNALYFLLIAIFLGMCICVYCFMVYFTVQECFS